MSTFQVQVNFLLSNQLSVETYKCKEHKITLVQTEANYLYIIATVIMIDLAEYKLKKKNK